jgi:hypothetical protein
VQPARASCDNRAGSPVTGFELLNNYCYAEVVNPYQPDKNCPDNTVELADGSGCEYYYEEDYFLSCESNVWALDIANETCTYTRADVQPLQSVCPSTHPENSDGLCETVLDITPLSFVCDTSNGYTLQNGSCAKVEDIVQADGFCLEPAQEVGGQCVTTIVGDNQYTCPAPGNIDTTLQVRYDRCVYTETILALPVSTCP